MSFQIFLWYFFRASSSNAGQSAIFKSCSVHTLHGHSLTLGSNQIFIVEKCFFIQCSLKCIYRGASWCNSIFILLFSSDNCILGYLNLNITFNQISLWLIFHWKIENAFFWKKTRISPIQCTIKRGTSYQIWWNYDKKKLWRGFLKFKSPILLIYTIFLNVCSFLRKVKYITSFYIKKVMHIKWARWYFFKSRKTTRQ